MRTTLHRTHWLASGAALVILGATSWMFGSCTPGEGITALESDVVVTLFDSRVDFGAIRTYAISDSIECGSVDCPNTPRDNDAAIIQRIESNLQARGYVPEPDPANNTPDVAVLLAVTQTDFYSLIGSPCWGYRPPGWGWYPPGWCWGYPPVMGAAYEYTTGTLAILMVDPNNPDSSAQEIPVVWSATLNGILNDTSASVENRVRAGIDQAFTQSPYLQFNP